MSPGQKDQGPFGDTGTCEWVSGMSERQQDARHRMGVRRCGEA